MNPGGRRPLWLWAVEIRHPKAWRLAMSIEMAANVYPVRRLAEAAAERHYRRHGYQARVIKYARIAVVGKAI